MDTQDLGAGADQVQCVSDQTPDRQPLGDHRVRNSSAHRKRAPNASESWPILPTPPLHLSLARASADKLWRRLKVGDRRAQAGTCAEQPRARWQTMPTTTVCELAEGKHASRGHNRETRADRAEGITVALPNQSPYGDRSLTLGACWWRGRRMAVREVRRGQGLGAQIG